MWSSVETGGPCPRARGKHAAVWARGYVYVLGGKGTCGAPPLRDFWRYCLATGQWEPVHAEGASPPALQEATAVAYQDRIYVFGGETAAMQHDTPLWIYDIPTNTWRKASKTGQSWSRRSKVAPTPGGRRGHSAHVFHDRMIVYGGYRDLRGSTNEIWTFYFETETWRREKSLDGSGNEGPARHRHAAALHGARLYVHGGQCDLRDCADLWFYDTVSHVWSPIRTPARTSPPARSGHAGVRAGAHFYIFGGEARGHPTNELWRFHFGSETWERIVVNNLSPSARVDCRALLVTGGSRSGRTPLMPARTLAPNPGILREITRLSSIRLRRGNRCSYSALAPDHDSTESLVKREAAALAKSHSAYLIDDRLPGPKSPKHADEAPKCQMSHDPISVPDFADMVLPTPVLSPTEATKLVYLDSEEEDEVERELASMRRFEDILKAPKALEECTVLSKSASVRFSKIEDEGELSTSDYASAEKVNRLSGASLGFCNPHYLGPDVRKLGTALTPDSGVGAGDIELRDLKQEKPRTMINAIDPDVQLHILLVGGKEPPHLALLQRPLSMWTYRLL